MQVVPHNNIKEIVWSQSPIPRRFNVIASHKEFLLAGRSREDAGFGVVGTVSEELQSQKRMSSAAFSQVDFDRVRLPFSVLRPNNHKIQSKPTENAFLGQAFTYLFGFACNQRSVSGVGRKNTAEIA